MALSAQIGYIVPLNSMLQLKSEINEKLTMLRVIHTINRYSK